MMATKRKENADRMRALAEELRKGKKPAKKAKAEKKSKKKESEFEAADKDGDGKLNEEEYSSMDKKEE